MIPQERNCTQGNCFCGLLDLKSACVRHAKKIGCPVRDGVGGYWTAYIKTGSESIFAGVLLSLVPNLEHLEIRAFNRHQNTWSTDEEVARVHPVRVKDLFECFSQFFDWVKLPALAKLRTLVKFSAIDWPLLGSLSLSKAIVHLDFSLSCNDYDDTFSRAGQLAIGLETLELPVSVDILSPCGQPERLYLTDLMTRMPGLKHV